MLEIIRLVLPVLVIAICLTALAVFSNELPRSSEFTMLNDAVDVTPVPERVMDCGLPLALSVMFSTAERAPAAAGVKLKAMVVLLPGATVIGGVAAAKVKSALFVPEMTICEIIKLALPVLLTVTGNSALAEFTN